MRMTTVLITGGTGFLGSNVLKVLLENDYHVVLLKRKNSSLHRIKDCINRIEVLVLENIDWDKLFADRAINVIVHCATNYGRINTSSIEVIDANLILPLRLLEFGVKYGVKCFVNSDTILNSRINFYSLSKKQFLQWFCNFSKQLVCVNVEIEHFYGPNDDPTKFVIAIVRQLLSDKKEILLTKGEQERYFVYIDDVVAAFKLVIDKSQTWKNGFYRYQIGSDTSITIKDFVERIKVLTGNMDTELKFGAVPYRKNETMIPKINTREIKKLGWKTTVDVDEGLRKTISAERCLKRQ